MCISFILFITAFISNSQQQPPPQHAVDCLHPSNYSDFSIILINNTIAITGGTTVNI
jgi:hypothetical protein